MPEETKPKNHNTGLIIGIIAGAVAVAALVTVIIIIAVSGNNGNNNGNNSNNTGNSSNTSGNNSGNTGGNTSGGNTSGGNTSGGNTSGGNTSGGNTSGNTSGGNTSGGGNSNNSNIVGVWKLVKLSGDGLELTGDQLEAFGMSGTIEFKSDGTGVTKIGDDETLFKYNASSNTLYDTDTDESVSYTIKNGQLTISEEDSTMVFEKQ